MTNIINEPKDVDLIWIRKTRNLPSIKTDIAPNMCNIPWTGMQIDRKGRVFICHCDGWLPYPVGNIMDFESIDEVYNSPVAKEIQQTIIDGTYKYCDTVHCPVKTDESTIQELGHHYIEFGIDQSCNLSCPSCRKNIIFEDDEKVIDEKIQWTNQFKKWINNSDYKHLTVLIGGNGEPFASPVYLNLLKNEFVNKNVTYHIRTNATLAKRHMGSLNFLAQLNQIEISIDAASKGIYEHVRQPGKWKNLLENIDYLLEMRKQYKFRMVGNFVIQRANLIDVLPFIDWCNERDITPWFTLLQNWASFDNFDYQCVHRKTDELYNEFIKIIKTEKFQKTKMGWLIYYKNEILI